MIKKDGNLCAISDEGFQLKFLNSEKMQYKDKDIEVMIDYFMRIGYPKEDENTIFISKDSLDGHNKNVIECIKLLCDKNTRIEIV